MGRTTGSNMTRSIFGPTLVMVAACQAMESPSGQDDGLGRATEGQPAAASATTSSGSLSEVVGGSASPGAGVTGGDASTTPSGAMLAPLALPASGGRCLEELIARLSDGGLDAGGDAAVSSEGSTGIGDVVGSVTVGPDADLGSGDLTVLVVFDKSGSMADSWDGRTKWEVANDSLEKALDGILNVITIGAILFPQPGGCDVAPIDSGLQFGFASGRGFWEAWQSMASARFPDGSTPLQRAFGVADDALERACTLGLLEQRFRVLLITDGEPTCSDDRQAIVDTAARWARAGVETQVLGLPGSAPAAELLDAIAAGGGTLQHQTIGDAGQLDDSVYAALR